MEWIKKKKKMKKMQGCLLNGGRSKYELAVDSRKEEDEIIRKI